MNCIAKWICVLSPLLAFSASSAQNIVDAPLGTQFNGLVAIAGRQIPLPAGNWVLYGVDNAASGTSSTGRIRLFDAILIQLKDGRLDRWIYFRTNLEASSAGGWQRVREICDRNDIHFSYSDKNFNSRETECWGVNHLVNTLGNNAAKIHKDFFEKSVNLQRPHTSLVSMFYLTLNANFITIYYHTNPEARGFERVPSDWRGNQWHKDAIAGDAERSEFVASVRSEGEALWPLLKRGLRGGLR